MTHSTNLLALASRGLTNYLVGRPLSVSFEVTYACNARCKHCHLGGPIPDEKRASAEQYGELCRTINPVVAQVSGGEPLLRRDLEDIIHALKTYGKAPMVVVTTNAALLTKERYQSLIHSGVDEFSVSLDYPDERHDDFRAIPGLFNKIQNLVNQIQNGKASRITFSCVVQNDNFRELPRLAQLAVDWNVKINFSTYTWLRTKDKRYMISRENLPELRDVANCLLAIRKAHGNVFASDYIFKRMIRFYKNEGIPGCRAGERFFIVNPDGTFSPCGLIQGNFTSAKQIKREFSSTNVCVDCNTSIRANCEKPMSAQIKDNLNTLFA